MEEGGGVRRGTCLLMCPEKERLRRQQQGHLSVFEVDKSSAARSYSSSPSLAVKEYVRSGAGQDVPHSQDLRPPPVLKNTIDYLIRGITTRTDHPWHLVYEFVDNRIRSIRQDIIYQQLEAAEIPYIYALASRFYLYSQYRLSSVSMEKFDRKLNGDQLQQCLLKLLKMHAVVVEPTSGLEVSLERRTEFESYFLLANLGNTEAITHALELPKKLRQHPKVRLSLAISRHFLDNNFIRLFRMTRKLSALEKCALFPHMTSIRRQAVDTMSTAYSSKNAQFPLRLLEEWLAFNCLRDTVEFTSAYGLEISGDSVLFRRGAFTVPAEEPRVRFQIPELDRDSPSNFIFGV